MAFKLNLSRVKGITLSRKLSFVGAIALSLGIPLLAPLDLFGEDLCSSALNTPSVPRVSQNGTLAGVPFLHQRDPKLHMNAFVEKIASQFKRTHEVEVSKPHEKISQWLNYLAQISIKAATSSWARNKVNEALYNQYVINGADIPESYYALQVQLARERGHGDVAITNEQKLQLADTVMLDQKHSLDYWTDFLISEDTLQYPMWLKYWILTGATKLSIYDAQTGTFGNRSKDTVTPFPEVNRNALAYVADIVIRKFSKQTLDDVQAPKLLQQLDGMNFGKIYGQVLFQLGVGKEGSFATNEGKWIKFPKGSDHMLLVNALEGRNTGWCTAGKATAKDQLEQGDFHIYFSLDAEGKPTVPRVAIRMEGNEIGEIRGVAKSQNIDTQILSTNIVSEKVQEFGQNGKTFLVKESNMKTLTVIEKKHLLNQKLSAEEIRFLYEIDGKIEGFGVKDAQDPRIYSIRKDRSLVDDFNTMFDSSPAFTGNIYLPSSQRVDGLRFPKEFEGEIRLESFGLDGVKLPEIMKGDLTLNHLNSAETIILPKEMTGALNLQVLSKVGSMTLPARMSGNVNLQALYKASFLKLPVELKGHAHLQMLSEIGELVLPKIMKGDLNLPRLVGTEDGKLTIPQVIAGNIDLSSLQIHSGLRFPKKMRGTIDLKSIKSGKKLILPDSLTGDLILDGLISLDGLRLPTSLKGELWLNRIESPAGLVLPVAISKEIRLGSLKSAEGIKFPEVIPYGGINLNALISAKGLQLPKKMKGSLIINSLVFPDDLKLPEEMGGRLYLDKLSSAAMLVMPKGVKSYWGPQDIVRPSM